MFRLLKFLLLEFLLVVQKHLRLRLQVLLLQSVKKKPQEHQVQLNHRQLKVKKNLTNHLANPHHLLVLKQVRNKCLLQWMLKVLKILMHEHKSLLRLLTNLVNIVTQKNLVNLHTLKNMKVVKTWVTHNQVMDLDLKVVDSYRQPVV